jgi:HPt (histidine-containing phosphotransfer) domain-containing protein
MKFHLEQKAIEDIKSLQRPGTPDILARLVNVYLDKAPDLVKEIDAGIAANDNGRVKMAAHALKSSSAYLGAKSLADQCEKLEHKAAGDDLHNAEKSVKNIANGVQDISKKIKRYI